MSTNTPSTSTMKTTALNPGEPSHSLTTSISGKANPTSLLTRVLAKGKANPTSASTTAPVNETARPMSVSTTPSVSGMVVESDSTAPDVGAVVQVTATPVTTAASLSSLPTITSTLTSSSFKPADKNTLLLKNDKNIVIATGKRLEGCEIHGKQLRSDCCKVAITSVLTAGSKTWFPDQFGEDRIEKGAIVQWPVDHTKFSTNVSPLMTRAKRKR